MRHIFLRGASGFVLCALVLCSNVVCAADWRAADPKAAQAFDAGNLTQVKKLLDDPERTYFDNPRVMASAYASSIASGNVKLLEYLEIKGWWLKIQVAKQSDLFWTIQLASEAGHNSAIEYFVRKGVDVAASDLNGNTVMHAAARGGHAQTVRYLCSLHVNPNRVNRNSKTALDVAEYALQFTRRGDVHETATYKAGLSDTVAFLKEHIVDGCSVGK